MGNSFTLPLACVEASGGARDDQFYSLPLACVEGSRVLRLHPVQHPLANAALRTGNESCQIPAVSIHDDERRCGCANGDDTGNVSSGRDDHER